MKDLRSLKSLLRVLRENGVTAYKDGALEVQIAAQTAHHPPEQETTEENPPGGLNLPKSWDDLGVPVDEEQPS